MFDEIDSEAVIDKYDVLGAYDPEDLHKTAAAFDGILGEYLKEYRKAGMEVKRFPILTLLRLLIK